MKILVTFITLALFSAPLRAEVREVPLPNNRKVAVTVDKVDDQLPWLVFLPGSWCGIVQADARPVALARKNGGYNLLIVNKAGSDVNGNCDWPEYNRASLRPQRIADIQSVLKSQLPADAKILLMGESEGGYIAPDVALSDTRVGAMILISAGTRSWIDEEVENTPAHKREQVRRHLKQEIVGHPDIDRFFRGWTYAQLNSYDNRQTYESLKKSAIPILALNGSLDRMIWVDAARADFENLIQNEGKSNIEFHFLKGADHGLNCTGSDCDPAEFERNLCSLLLEFGGKVLKD